MDGVDGLRIENELRIVLVFTGDEAAHAKVTELSQDLAALAQEWMLPPR